MTLPWFSVYLHSFISLKQLYFIILNVLLDSIILKYINYAKGSCVSNIDSIGEVPRIGRTLSLSECSRTQNELIMKKNTTKALERSIPKKGNTVWDSQIENLSCQKFSIPEKNNVYRKKRIFMTITILYKLRMIRMIKND